MAAIGSVVTGTKASHAQRARPVRGATLIGMIRVYRSPDGVARYISFDDADVPSAALELVRVFRDEEREEAWDFLLRLAGQPTAA